MINEHKHRRCFRLMLFFRLRHHVQIQALDDGVIQSKSEDEHELQTSVISAV